MTKGKGVDPKIWGASAWRILHRLSFTFKSAKTAYEFYRSLLYLLPCPKCRMRFAKHIDSLPFPRNHKYVSNWVIKLHNMVNATLEKPSIDLSLDQVRIANQEVDPDEWVFIAAIAHTHPGKRYISPEYANALETFLKYWASVSLPERDVIESRQSFKRWVNKNKTTNFEVTNSCNSNTCELRTF